VLEPSSGVPIGDVESERGAQATGERRRFPRSSVGATTARLPLVVQAEILDISLSGALIRCECALNLGDRAQLHALLDREAFTAGVSVVRVRRDRSAAAPEARSVGIVFTAIDQACARALSEFLKT